MQTRSERRPERSPVRLLIIADSDARAQGLAAMLADDERLDIYAAIGRAGLPEVLDEQTIDVGLAVALSPVQIPPLLCPIVVLSDSPEPGFTVSAKVHAWLPLNSSFEELSAALFAAACDLAVLTSDQLSRYRSHPADADDSAIPPFVEKLTPREMQVLRMIADGLGNKEIAAQLGVSNHTAKFHVAQILAKLGATSRTEAVTIGIRRGLVPV